MGRSPRDRSGRAADLFRFLNSTPARLVTLLLVVQAALLYSSIRPEVIPDSKPLAEFPQTIGPWQEVQEGVIDQETRDVLKADDLLNRVYVDRANRRGADLFVAAFRTQRNGKAPHSPKNCLPGNGWTPLNSSEFQIDVGRQEPITVNRWVVAHGDDRSLVLYWYQSRDRAIASEYKAKFWVILDAMRLNRTDTALIRIVVPIANRDEERAVRTAVDFVKSFYGAIRQSLPA
jgi:EpsI family protein